MIDPRASGIAISLGPKPEVELGLQGLVNVPGKIMPAGNVHLTLVDTVIDGVISDGTRRSDIALLRTQEEWARTVNSKLGLDAVVDTNRVYILGSCACLSIAPDMDGELRSLRSKIAKVTSSNMGIGLDVEGWTPHVSISRLGSSWLRRHRRESPIQDGVWDFVEGADAMSFPASLTVEGLIKFGYIPRAKAARRYTNRPACLRRA